MGRDLSVVERAGLVAGGDILRSIEQSIGRDLSVSERDNLVQDALVTRIVEQALGRDLSAAERAGLLQAGSVVRSVEQTLGRALSTAERALVIESATVERGINQTIFAPTGTIVVPQNEAVLRGIFQQVLAASGATLLDAETVVRIVRQAVETTETVAISRSIDDKLSGLLTTANSILATMQGDIAATRGLTNTVALNTQTLIDDIRGGNAGEGGSNGPGFALGGVFAGGTVVPFARGGIPDLVNRPTLAPMALFGEAGPEAIMPLRRNSSGRLGVEATRPVVQVDLSALATELAALRREVALLRGEVRAGHAGTHEGLADLRKPLARAVSSR